VPAPQRPRARAAPQAAPAALIDGGLDGEDLEEDEELTGDVSTGSLRSALTLLAKNQAALTTMLADRDKSSSGGGSSSTDAMSLKGPGLLLRRRRLFQADPEKPFNLVTERAGELLHVEDGVGGSLERYGREIVPWGPNRLAKVHLTHCRSLNK